jgi:recombinational DNA repair protein (RecF pathway)
MKCRRCLQKLNEQERYEYLGQVLCEDCYIDSLQPPRPCDPTAVSSARATRRQLGQQGTDGLTKLQKEIYEFIKEKGRVTRQEIKEHFNLPEWELEKQFAVLRHCELISGRKEGDKVYFLLLPG